MAHPIHAHIILTAKDYPSTKKAPIWLAGAIVPSVVLFLVLLAIGIIWARKHRRAKRTRLHATEAEEGKHQDKAQLHSECLPRPVFELEGPASSKAPVEKPANEVPARELPA